jgi:hypothetical protein
MNHLPRHSTDTRKGLWCSHETVNKPEAQSDPHVTALQRDSKRSSCVLMKLSTNSGRYMSHLIQKWLWCSHETVNKLGAQSVPRVATFKRGSKGALVFS